MTAIAATRRQLFRPLGTLRRAGLMLALLAASVLLTRPPHNFDYEAFGATLGAGAAATDYLFAGEQWDLDLNAYFLRARYLKYSEGRFETFDSFEGLIVEPSTLHKYAYAENNPVLLSDPSGNFAGVAGTLAGASILNAVAGMILAIATIKLVQVTQKFDHEYRLYHYTTFTNAILIEASGFMMPGVDGFSYFTDESFSTGREAVQRLALFNLANRDLVPVMRFEISLFNPADFVLGPFPVDGRPFKGGYLPGGGREYISGKPVINIRDPRRRTVLTGIVP